MRILFVRHGHPDYGRDCLTDLGHLQAAAAAERLREENIAEIYSSTCGRALETAGHTAEALGLDVVRCDFMREIHWGTSSGEPLPSDGHPWDAADLMVSEGKPLLNHSWNSEEPFLRNRLLKDYQKIAGALDAWLADFGYVRDGLYYRIREDSRKTVAAFCHGGASSVMLSHMFNLPFPFTCAAIGLDFTGITAVTLSGPAGSLVTPRFEMVNDAKHIREYRIKNIYGK